MASGSGKALPHLGQPAVDGLALLAMGKGGGRRGMRNSLLQWGHSASWPWTSSELSRSCLQLGQL